MSIRDTLAALFAAAALVACGAGQSPSESTAKPPVEAKHGDHHKSGHDHGDHGKGEHADKKAEKHAGFPATVTKFHDVMAPLWHAKKGEKRTADTCTAVAEFRAASVAVQGDAVPEKAKAQAADWKAAATGLTAAVDALEAACVEDKRPNFEAKFMALHHAFHGLVKLVGHKH